MTHPLFNAIKIVPNFPKNGIDFYDITPLLAQGNLPKVTQALLDVIDPSVLAQTDCFVGVESRGFVFATAMAMHTGKDLALVRKQGKLPPPVHRYHYTTEYSQDTLEISEHIKPCKVIIVDDILATGGTLTASIALAKQAGHEVLGCAVLLDLVALHKPLDDIYALMQV